MLRREHGQGFLAYPRETERLRGLAGAISMHAINVRPSQAPGSFAGWCPLAGEIEFYLLGPLLVRCGGAAMRLPPGKQRTVLAALILDAGRALSLDELAEVLWSSAPPPSARVTVQNYVKRVRKGLGPAAGSRIITQPRGYLIQADPGEMDVSRFEAHLPVLSHTYSHISRAPRRMMPFHCSRMTSSRRLLQGDHTARPAGLGNPRYPKLTAGRHG
jgi:DNA-binding winged helix-turn-helix (wHTH) protein